MYSTPFFVAADVFVTNFFFLSFIVCVSLSFFVVIHYYRNHQIAYMRSCSGTHFLYIFLFHIHSHMHTNSADSEWKFIILRNEMNKPNPTQISLFCSVCHQIYLFHVNWILLALFYAWLIYIYLFIFFLCLLFRRSNVISYVITVILLSFAMDGYYCCCCRYCWRFHSFCAVRILNCFSTHAKIIMAYENRIYSSRQCYMTWLISIEF